MTGVLMINLHESILDEEGLIDQEKIDLVARLGASWYSRVTPESLFKVDKPLRRMGMGVDRLPEHIRLSNVLTGNHRGKLGNVDTLPSREEVEAFGAQERKSVG